MHEKATHQQTRTYNRQLVLRTIFDYGTLSRADVARLTQLTPVTVSELVAELLADQLVSELDLHASGELALPTKRGRRPILLQVAAASRQLIALRLAVHEFRAALLDLNGEILYSKSLAVGPARGQEAVQQLTALTDELVAHATQPILGIGVASPGIVDTQSGTVRRSVFFGWNNLPIGKLLHERYQRPVHVANASQVAALAEYLFGSNRTLRNLAVLRVGQDVGAGLILDGQLFFGDGFGAGEIGHMVVDPQGERCACGNFGCLETQVSSQAMVRQAQALAATAPDSQLARALAAASSPALEAVVEAFRAGDPLAAQLVQANARYVSQAVAALVALLNIQQIRLVGSITQFGTAWLEAVRAALPGTAIPDLVCQTTLEIAEHGSDAVILGAAALLLSRELGLTLSRYQEPRSQPRGGGAL